MTDLNAINRTFTPDLFEKASGAVFENGGERAMVIRLDSVTTEDERSIFCGRFEAP